MLKLRSFYFKSAFLLVFALFYSKSAISQNDEVEIELPSAKNAIAVHPLAAVLGFYGLSYERYIAKGFSVYAYGELIDGPKLFSTNVNRWVTNSMGAERASVYYTGFGGTLGVRRYFENKKYSLVGNKDMGSLIGWFVGAYVPWRSMMISVKTISFEDNPNVIYPLINKDNGSYKFNGHIYGLGFEGGKHWVWDRFNFELNVGIAYMQGLPKSATFNYTSTDNIFGSYSVDKSLGLINTYGTFAPKFEIVMGIAF